MRGVQELCKNGNYPLRGTEAAELRWRARRLGEFEVEAVITWSCIEPKGQNKNRSRWAGTYKSQEQNENNLRNTSKNVVHHILWAKWILEYLFTSCPVGVRPCGQRSHAKLSIQFCPLLDNFVIIGDFGFFLSTEPFSLKLF